MKTLALALLAILAVVALRRREPDRAVMRPTTAPHYWVGSCGVATGGNVPCPDPDLQPGDPYSASLLP